MRHAYRMHDTSAIHRSVDLARQVMLAHAPRVAYTTFLVIFGCLGFLPVAALRAEMGPPALGVNLGYAITREPWQNPKPSNFCGVGGCDETTGAASEYGLRNAIPCASGEGVQLH